MSGKDVALIGVLLFAAALIFFVGHFALNTVVDEMLTNPVINSSNDAINVLSGAKTTSNNLDYVVFGVFVGLILSLIITSWFIGGNPIFMFIYFIVTIISVILSAVLANTWETLSQASVFGTTVNNFVLTNHLISYLPFYIAGVGMIGMIVMFAKPNEEGGGGYY